MFDRRLRRLIPAALLAWGCAPSLDTGCSGDDDCPSGQTCAAQHCVPAAGEVGDLGTGGVDGSAGGGQATGDAAPPVQDAARPGPDDARTPADDAAEPTPDADQPEPDAGRPTDDARPPEKDATVSPDDAARPREDAAPPPHDAARPPEDARPVPPDAPSEDCMPTDPPDEVCDTVDNDCDGVVDNLDQPCTAGVGQCLAGGFLACDDDHEPVCMASPGPPRAEMCDGLDNDCDGLTDEDIFSPCYSGPLATRGLGTCEPGYRTCELGFVTECREEVLPAEEICDGLDNDCDGVADEDIPPEPCYPGDPQDLDTPETACRLGLSRCAGGVWSACEDAVLPAEADGCNGVDDDCRAPLDEHCQCQDGLPCEGIEVGACRVGTQVCDGDGRLLACAGFVGSAPETCNGADDDCNGQVDDGSATATCYGGHVATRDVGLCRAGVRRCVDGTPSDVCEGEVLPGPERCNGLDDDCDGQIDEDFEDIGLPCTAGLGACTQAGVIECLPDASAAACTAVPALPQPESCNGADDDCDGQTDEGADVPCYDGPAGTQGVGLCRGGLRACQNGALGACAGQVLPRVEACDPAHADEDCDGTHNEGCMCADGEQVRCGNDLPPCEAGVQTCTAGVFGPCEGGRGPEPETCNGVDDDCNAQIDDAEFREPCYSGPEGTLDTGLCQGGLTTCKDGTLVCAGEVVPAEEICNGLDDDCNSLADDLPLNIQPEACQTNLPGRCALGTLECKRGVPVCEANREAIPEVCNGEDDDCDGTTDEPLVVTRGDFELVPGTALTPRPALGWSGRGFMTLYGVPAINGAGRYDLIARAVAQNGVPERTFGTIALAQNPGSTGDFHVTLVPSSRALETRRFVVSWVENGSIRYNAVGDDGEVHGAVTQSILAQGAGAVITEFDTITLGDTMLVLWTERVLNLAGSSVYLGFASDNAVPQRPTLMASSLTDNFVNVRLAASAGAIPRFAAAWNTAGPGSNIRVQTFTAAIGRPTDVVLGGNWRLQDMTAVGEDLALVYTNNQTTQLWASRFSREGQLLTTQIVHQGANNKNGAIVEPVADGGLSVFWRETDSIYHVRVNRENTRTTPRQLVGPAGQGGSAPAAAREGQAVIWTQDTADRDTLHMAQGDFQCAP